MFPVSVGWAICNILWHHAFVIINAINHAHGFKCFTNMIYLDIFCLLTFCCTFQLVVFLYGILLSFISKYDTLNHKPIVHLMALYPSFICERLLSLLVLNYSNSCCDWYFSIIQGCFPLLKLNLDKEFKGWKCLALWLRKWVKNVLGFRSVQKIYNFCNNSCPDTTIK